MRFLCDAMLGHLARDLRILGYDAAYCDGPDAELWERARREARVLLTRDRQLAARGGAGGVLVHATDPDMQLDEVAGALGLRPDPERFLTRCTGCNVSLQEEPAAAHRTDLPEAVRDRPGTVAVCPACHRLYWDGSHVAAMRERLARFLN